MPVNLEAERIDVLEAADGQSGADVARRERPDLILLDTMMPGLDGWRVGNRLSEDPETHDIPLVFVAPGPPNGYRDYVRAFDVGAAEYITFPFNPMELPGRIRQVLDRLARAERESLRAERLKQLEVMAPAASAAARASEAVFAAREDAAVTESSRRSGRSGLLRDSDWAPLDGEVCRVTAFTALGFAKGLPYASVELASPRLAEATTGFVTHKLDFEHLSEAFSQRESEPNTEVLIIWTKRFLRRGAKLVARFTPRMWVMLCRANTYELMTDQTYKPELVGLDRHLFQEPIAEWKPDVVE
jgi:CheY-like chemotaxis protein